MLIGLLNGLQNYEFLLISPNKSFSGAGFIRKVLHREDGKTRIVVGTMVDFLCKIRKINH